MPKLRLCCIRSIRCWLVLASVVLPCHVTGAAQQNLNGQLPIGATPQPYLFLIRDPVVLDELRVDDQQRASIRSLNDELDVILWSMRNQKSQHQTEKIGEATAIAKKRLASILRRPQRERLGQIELWAVGLRAFLGEDLPDLLKLTEVRRQEIRNSISETQQTQFDFAKQVRDGGDAEALQKKADKMQEDLQREILAKLSEHQKQQWIDLLGRKIDLSALGRVTFAAPEISEEPDWINSSALSFDQLKGKVVALHFYAFGCINCKRNFPWYKQWHQLFHHRGLVVLGVQTPETDQERVVEKVRSAALENGLKYPIVVDNKKRIWNAWGNSMWPSTYLIDKQGRVRYWWYGELDWKDAGSQNVLRSRIKELLAEEEE